MKKFIVFILAMAFLLTGNTIFAEKTQTYLKGSLGLLSATNGKMKITDPISLDFADITTKPGFIFSGAYGFQSKQLNWFRGEIEISYQKYKLDKATNIIGGDPDVTLSDATMSSLAFMANAYADLYNNSQITPYIMFGLGFSSNSVGDSDKDNWTAFSYQAGLGIGYALDKQLTLDLGYRYFKTGKDTPRKVIISGTPCEFEYNPGGTHNFMAGFRYNW